MTSAELQRRFTHLEEQSSDQAKRHIHTDVLFLEFARELNRYIADGREKSLMMTKLEEARHWANEGIAKGGDHADAT